MSEARRAPWHLRPWALVCAGVLGLITLSLFAAEEGLRDPFLFWPPEEDASPPAPQAPAPMLNGILWDVANPLALIEGEAVGVGHTVAGWQIIEIRPEAIVVQRDLRRQILVPGKQLPAWQD